MPGIVDIMPKRPLVRRLANPLVVVVAYDGLCTFEFGCAVEIFGLPRPEMGGNWYGFAVASAEPGPLRATGGVQVIADGGLDLLTKAGTVIVPGWRAVDAPVPEGLISALRDAHAAGARKSCRFAPVRSCWPRLGCWTSGTPPRIGATRNNSFSAIRWCALCQMCSTWMTGVS